jgi:hypothetical protein
MGPEDTKHRKLKHASDHRDDEIIQTESTTKNAKSTKTRETLLFLPASLLSLRLNQVFDAIFL